ncbi:filamentous hemagglutinin N-terminal domain-containing protein [Burkholderia seminalis]|uniref:two-partner secretion domain-containing protein n=1 Tax=Burkholderia seminalis TaxID=488731 RepID=UPI001CF2EC69|nr:filamentous hemagglutinin N-terminal domain-containing protein [Burkholderia seminalis]MCA7954178.1 filamentous hemagglutinin N-terminal domain-containing protein [Burkholderia seminalis]
MKNNDIERIGRVHRLLAFLVMSGPVLQNAAYAVTIVPDGSTATSVSVGVNGHQTVNIAPAIGGVSNNTYSSFNVSKAGADLNNVGINARTIVNQVTSTNPSLIHGNINVLGPRANVILANPNGVTVDGGNFTNTGHVVLSTGQVSFADVALAPGTVQRNVVLNTDRGTITIGAGGLTGDLIGLDLVAKQLALNGPVTNTYDNKTGVPSFIRGTVGSSTTSWNGGMSPTDNGHDWRIGASFPGATSKALAVDITAAGGLTAGRVELIITDQGAGVRSLGKLYANAGDAVVTSTGDVTIADNQFFGAHDASISTTGAVTLQGAQLNAGNNATVHAGSISLSDDAAGPSTLSANNTVNLTSSGAITNIGSVIQAGTTANGTPAGGILTLSATGDILNGSSAANQGIIFSANGTTSLTAGGNIINDNARIASNGGMSLTAAGDVQNVIDHSGGTNGGQPAAYTDRGGSFLFFTHSTTGVNVDYGTVNRPDQIAYLATTSGPLTITGRNVTNSGGVIQATAGDVTITAQNAFTNAAVFSGKANYSRSCWIFCHANASSNVTPYGGTIQASGGSQSSVGGNISIKSGAVARNVGGNVFATGDIMVDAPVTYAQGVTGYSAINQDRGFKAFFGSTWAQLIAMDIGGGFAANGQVFLTGDGVIDGGSFSGGKGVTAAGGITTVRAPSRTPVSIDQHLGLTTWWWR